MKQWNLQRVWPTETRQQSDLNSGISDFHQGRGFLLSPHFQPSHPMNVASLLSPSCHDTLLVFWVPQWRTHGWIYWGVQWRFPFGTTQFPASAQVCASVCERATFTQAWPPSLGTRASGKNVGRLNPRMLSEAEIASWRRSAPTWCFFIVSVSFPSSQVGY